MRGPSVAVGCAFALAFAVAATSIHGQAQDTINNPAPIQDVAAPEGPPEVPWAPPPVLYDNGPLVTHPGGGASGSDASRLQNSSLGMSTIGFTASVASGFRIADNFTIPCGVWQVETITSYAYQRFSGTTSTINDVRVQIWDGPPNEAGSSVVWGDTTTNRLAGTGFSTIYRDTETAAGNSERPIMFVDATVGIPLPAGTYWVDLQLGGTLTSGPFVPPTTVTGSNSPCSPCNGLQWNGSAWIALNDSGSLTRQDVKFEVRGSRLGVDLWVMKDDSPDPVEVGGSLTYTLTVANGGSEAVDGVVVTDTLPDGVTFVNASGIDWTCVEAGGTVTCTLPCLLSHYGGTITIEVTAPPVAGEIVNTASVAPLEDEVPTNNTATETTTVVVPPAFTSRDNTTFNAGQLGRFIVTTTGTPAPAITLSGALPRGVSLVDNHNGTATLSGIPAAGTVGVHIFDLVADNGISTTQTFALKVVGARTTLMVITSKNPSIEGQPIRATARVSFFTRTLGTPTGTISFFHDGVFWVTVPVASAQASTPFVSPPAGTYKISAVYSGDGSFNSSKAVITQEVWPLGP